MKTIIEENGKLILKDDALKEPTINDILDILSIILLNQVNEKEE